MIDNWAPRGVSCHPTLRSILLLIVLVSLSACARPSSAPPRTAPAPSAAADPVDDVAELIVAADGYFSSGEAAYGRGEYATADERFQRALDVYLDANIGPQDRAALQSAFNDLFNRIHALSINGLIGGAGELVVLDEEELPSPSAEDLADLHARLEA